MSSGHAQQTSRGIILSYDFMKYLMPGDSGRIVRLVLYGILITVTFGLYAKSVNFDFIANWDDNTYVIENELIRSISLDAVAKMFTTPVQANYAPLHIMSYAIDYALWGLDPAGYHLVNILLHVLNVCLVFLLARRLLGKDSVAFFVALGFAVHPLNVENVAWVSERKTLLASAFCMSAFIAYLKSRERAKPAYYWISLLLFQLAVLSKATAVILPLLIISYEFLLGGGKPISWRLAPYLLISAAGAAMTVAVHFQSNVIDAETIHPDMLLSTVYPTMAVVYWKYIHLLFIPHDLSGFYDAVLYGSFLDPPVFLSICAWCCVLFIVLRWGTQQVRFLFFWYWICFLPTANIMPIPVYYADRYMYLPAIGVFIIAGLTYDAFLRHARASVVNAYRTFAPVAAAAVIIVYGVVSYNRLDVWANELVFWQDTAEKSPNVERVQGNLGEAYWNRDMLPEAEQAFRRQYAIEPKRSTLATLQVIIEQQRIEKEQR